MIIELEEDLEIEQDDNRIILEKGDTIEVLTEFVPSRASKVVKRKLSPDEKVLKDKAEAMKALVKEAKILISKIKSDNAEEYISAIETNLGRLAGIDQLQTLELGK